MSEWGGKGYPHSVWSFFSVFWSNRQEVNSFITKWSNIGMSCAYLPWHEYELHVELKVLHDALNLIPLPGGKKKQCQCQSQAHSKTGLTFASWTFWAGGENTETFCYVLSPQAQTRVNTNRSLETKTLFFTNTLELFTQLSPPTYTTVTHNRIPTLLQLCLEFHLFMLQPALQVNWEGKKDDVTTMPACMHAHAWPICTCLLACMHMFPSYRSTEG